MGMANRRASVPLVASVSARRLVRNTRNRAGARRLRSWACAAAGEGRLMADRRLRGSGFGQSIQLHHLDGRPVRAIHRDHEIHATARGANDDGVTRRAGGRSGATLQRDRMRAGAAPGNASAQDAGPRRWSVHHSQWNRTERGRRLGHGTCDISR